MDPVEYVGIGILVGVVGIAVSLCDVIVVLLKFGLTKSSMLVCLVVFVGTLGCGVGEGGAVYSGSTSSSPGIFVILALHKRSSGFWVF